MVILHQIKWLQHTQWQRWGISASFPLSKLDQDSDFQKTVIKVQPKQTASSYTVLIKKNFPSLPTVHQHAHMCLCVCVCTHDSVECSVGGPIKAMTGRWLKMERASWSRWWQKIAMTEGGVTGKAGNGAFEKSMRAAPGKAAERDLCLCVSRVGR